MRMPDAFDGCSGGSASQVTEIFAVSSLTQTVEIFMTTLQDTMQQIGRQARQASRVMMRASGAQKTQALLAMAEALSAQRSALQRANASDVDAARARQLEPALLDRLTLSERSIDVMIEGPR